MLDLGTLKSRACSTGCRAQLAAVAQHHLSVGPNVNEEDHLVLLVGLLGDDTGHVIRPHEAGLIGQHVDVAGRVDGQAEIPRLDVQGVMEGRRIGGRTQITGIDIQEDVVHTGVAHQHRFVDVRWFKAGFLGDALDKGV